MKKYLTCLLVFVLAATLIGCRSEGYNLGAPVSVIRIGIMPDVESIPLLIADVNGYFAEAGADVQLELFRSARDRDSALQSELLDGVVTDMIAVFFANEGGFPLQIIASTDGTIFLLAERDSAAKNINDIQSKSVGLSTNTVMEYTLDAMMKQAGLPGSAVNKIAIPQIPTRMEMLQNGQVDLAMLPEPWAGLAIQNGAKIVMTTQELGHKPGVIAFRESMVASNPDAIRAIFQAYDRAVEFLNHNDPSVYIDLVIEQLSFPAETKTTLQIPFYYPARIPEEAVFYLVQDWLKEKNLLQNDWSYDQIVDQDFLKE